MSASSKAPPTDDPDVDDLKADSLKAPTMMTGLSGEFTSKVRYLAEPITMTAGQRWSIAVGGYDTAGDALDTVAYVYGPKDAHGKRGAYLVRNDDRADGEVASRLDLTAPRSGEYLIVMTTYHKPDPGNAMIVVDCASCFAPGQLQGAPQIAKFVDARAFPDPEVLIAPSVDATLAALQADVDDGDPLTIASAINALWGGRKWPLDVVDHVDQAVHAALPTATTFAGWPARAQGVLLTSERVFTEAAATKPPAYAPILDAMAATWPGSTWGDDEAIALLYNGRLYGYRVDFHLHGSDGGVWSGHEYFTRTGAWLGDYGSDFDDPD